MKLKPGRPIVILAYPHPHTQAEPAAGERINGSCLSSQQRRLSRGADHNARHETNALGGSGRDRKDRKGLQGPGNDPTVTTRLENGPRSARVAHSSINSPEI